MLDLLYPPLCRWCQERLPRHDGRNVCDSCWNRMDFIQDPVCQICGHPLEAWQPENRRCARCPIGEIHFDRAVAVVRYSGVLRESIHWFKYRYKKALRESLGQLMLQGMRERLVAEPYDAILPVPLHWWKQRWREFNQAALLAQPLAHHRQVPLLDQALVRTKYTRPQSNLGAHQARRKNIAGAFSVVQPIAVQGLSILLVDDLYTSGSTVNECARVLKAAGARRVDVLTLARAISASHSS